MTVSRKRRRRFASIGCGALVLAALPNAIGYQDLGALLVRQPAVTERARAHLAMSPFGTIHAATFSFPRPVGTAIPHAPVYALANFDPADITGSIGAQPLGEGGPLRFPRANRLNKSDLALSRTREPLPPLPPLLDIPPAPQAGVAAGGRFDPYAKYEFAALPDKDPGAAPDETSGNDLPPYSAAVPAAGRVYFGVDPLAGGGAAIAPWQPGEAPRVLAAQTAGDPDIKPAALAKPLPDETDAGGESIALKGEVTGALARPFSPAERLGLKGEERAKSQKCLANAVYFESRGEPVRGQIAVAQVVLNRVFSPFYPNNVCDVVYQNVHRHNACQFTFACDGIPDVVTEPDAWTRADRIANDMLDGKLWMPEVAKSTHYHASYVRPNWIGEMKKLYHTGIHSFYRPHLWGDGADEPHWGDAKMTEALAKQL
ncbi:MAG: cell wall hydrolase [Pseudolabrys sp.]|nr:cell wall hydrolase [Pseudolabrys sp.]